MSDSRYEERDEIEEAQVFVSDLRLSARVGVNPGEQRAEQPILVDVWVGMEKTDLQTAVHSERLRDTVDYVGVARAVRKVVERRHYPLVENLVSAIGHVVLDRPGASWVRVRLKKLDCLKHASGAGAEVMLRRSEEIHLRPIDPKQVRDPEEVVVVGAGAAGFAAALWCWRLGYPALLVDPSPADRLGGQLQMVHGLMHDLPAMAPMTGRELARKLLRQFIAHQGRWLQARLLGVGSTERDKRAGCVLELELERSDQRRTLRSRAVILTMGVRRRTLDLPGEDMLVGRGVLTTAAKAEAIAWLEGKRVVVVGGGDSACENALLLTRAGASVTLAHRGERLSARKQFQEQVEQHPEINVLLSSQVTRLVGSERLEGVEVRHGETREVLPASAALIRIGWRPNSEPLDKAWLDERGFVRCDSDGLISEEAHWFAAGDLLGRISPSVATAFGTGSSAARAACLSLERSRASAPLR